MWFVSIFLVYVLSDQSRESVRWRGYKIALFHQRSARRRVFVFAIDKSLHFLQLLRCKKDGNDIKRVNFVPQIGGIIVTLISKDL